MRVVAGRWAGRSLTSPGGRVRPTTEALRDAWMSMMAPDLADASVLDLFAGSGALGLEALSRGAARCDFVENGSAALHALKANVTALRLGRRARIFKRDAIPFVDRLAPFSYDVAFADPPYGSRKLDRVVTRWQDVPFAEWLAVEHDPDHPPAVRGRTRRVGDSAVTILHARRRSRPDTR